MSTHAYIQIGLTILLALLVAFVAFKVGRRWRREYRAAVRHRLDLENTVKTQAEALSAMRADLSATASGNVVVIGDGSSGGDLGRSDSLGSSGLWTPAVVRGGDRGRPDLRQELTTDEHIGVSSDVGELRAAELDRELGSGGYLARRFVDGRRVRPDGG